MTIQCCVCHAIRGASGEWEPCDHEIAGSHTYCQQCLDKAMADFAAEQAANKTAQTAHAPMCAA